MDTRQAGQEVRCDCGTTLEVPTLKGVTALERVVGLEEGDQLPEPKTSGGWGALQAAAVMGGCVLLLGIVLFAFFRANVPPPLEYPVDLDEFTPAQTFFTWVDLREGPPRDERIEKRYLPAVATNKRWQIASVAMVVIGAMTLGGALLGLRANRKPVSNEIQGRSASE